MIRMIDIAGETGVSRTAVSQILNEGGKEFPLSDEPIAKVGKPALNLVHIRNELANFMGTGEKSLLALLFNFSGYMIKSIQDFPDGARSRRHSIQLIPRRIEYSSWSLSLTRQLGNVHQGGRSGNAAFLNGSVCQVKNLLNDEEKYNLCKINY